MMRAADHLAEPEERLLSIASFPSVKAGQTDYAYLRRSSGCVVAGSLLTELRNLMVQQTPQFALSVTLLNR
jgi:hypothetical protein